MAELDSFDELRLARAERVAKAMYSKLVEKVIAEIKALPENCRQSGDDSVLKDVWEEFKYQFQREHSVVFAAYEDTIQRMCAGYISELDREQQQLLWIWSKAYFHWDDEDDEMPWGDFVKGDVAQELYDRVCDVANNEELVVDPDDERDRERYEDDKHACESLDEAEEDDSANQVLEDTTPFPGLTDNQLGEMAVQGKLFPESLTIAQYVDPARFPHTTQEGLGFHLQRRLDSANSEDFIQIQKEGRGLTPKQRGMLLEIEEKSKHRNALDKEAEALWRKDRAQTLADLNEHPANVMAARLLQQVDEPLHWDTLPLLQLTIWWLEHKARPEADDLKMFAYSLMSRDPFAVSQMFLEDFEEFGKDVEELEESPDERIKQGEAAQTNSREELLNNHLGRLLRSMKEEASPERVGKLLAENLHNFSELGPQ